MELGVLAPDMCRVAAYTEFSRVKTGCNSAIFCVTLRAPLGNSGRFFYKNLSEISYDSDANGTTGS